MTFEHRPVVSINPGSGPVPDGTYEQALHNINVLLFDADVASAVVLPDNAKADANGRYLFVIQCNGRQSEVLMPGLPLEQVRYVRAEDQNIWDFPRLYVDGSSWVWCYAMGMLHEALFGENEEL